MNLLLPLLLFTLPAVTPQRLDYCLGQVCSQSILPTPPECQRPKFAEWSACVCTHIRWAAVVALCIQECEPQNRGFVRFCRGGLAPLVSTKTTTSSSSAASVSSSSVGATAPAALPTTSTVVMASSTVVRINTEIPPTSIPVATSPLASTSTSAMPTANQLPPTPTLPTSTTSTPSTSPVPSPSSPPPPSHPPTLSTLNTTFSKLEYSILPLTILVSTSRQTTGTGSPITTLPILPSSTGSGLSPTNTKYIAPAPPSSGAWKGVGRVWVVGWVGVGIVGAMVV